MGTHRFSQPLSRSVKHAALLLSGLVLSLSALVTSAQDIERIRADIASGNAELQRSALIEIRKLRTEQASRLALPLLQNADEIVRASAAGAVIYLPSNEAASALLPLLNDKKEFVRQEAAYALGDAGDSSAVSRLIRAVQKDKDPVRNASIVALGKIGDPAAADVLIQRLKTKPNEENEFMQRAAARSIGQIAEYLRTGIRSAVTPQNHLPAKYKQLPQTSVADAPSGVRRAVPVLIDILRNPKYADDARREAAFALGAIGDRSAIPALQAHLHSVDNHLVEIAKEALIKLGVSP